MLGNFMYCNPTKLYFGEDSLARLNEELPPNLPQLLYIGFKLIPQIPYKIGV